MALRLHRIRTLFFTVVMLVCFGLVIVYSASSMVATLNYNKPSHHFLVRQAGWAVVSFCFLMYFKLKDYRDLRSPIWAFGSLSVVLFLLVVVYFMDLSSTHRWFRMGSFSITTFRIRQTRTDHISCINSVFSRRLAVINSSHTLLPAGLALAVIALTVIVADLGTALVLVSTAAVVFFVAGLKLRYFGYATMALVLLVIGAWLPNRTGSAV